MKDSIPLPSRGAAPAAVITLPIPHPQQRLPSAKELADWDRFRRAVDHCAAIGTLPVQIGEYIKRNYVSLRRQSNSHGLIYMFGKVGPIAVDFKVMIDGKEGFFFTELLKWGNAHQIIKEISPRVSAGRESETKILLEMISVVKNNEEFNREFFSAFIMKYKPQLGSKLAQGSALAMVNKFGNRALQTLLLELSVSPAAVDHRHQSAASSIADNGFAQAGSERRLPAAPEVLSVVTLFHAVGTVYSKLVKRREVPAVLSVVTLSLEVEPVGKKKREVPAVAVAVPALPRRDLSLSYAEKHDVLCSRQDMPEVPTAAKMPAESSTHWRDSVLSRLAAPSNKRAREGEILQTDWGKTASVLLDSPNKSRKGGAASVLLDIKKCSDLGRYTSKRRVEKSKSKNDTLPIFGAPGNRR